MERPPNIILVLVDDLGREALESYGGTSYKTPVLSKMANDGVQFNHAYAYPLCTPTRVSLMTGKYNFRNWKAFGILDPQEKTIGHLMQDQGYVTCLVGKWQLTSYDPPNYPQSNLRRNKGMKIESAGFDEYSAWHVGHTEDKGSRFADPIIFQNGQFLTNSHDRYGPDIFSDYLIDFMERHKEEPFFIYYPMALTHSPFVPTPDSEEWKDRTKRHQQDNEYFTDMVAYTDKVMGKILKNLERHQLAENTLVIFYSDNGTKATLTSKMGDAKIKGGKGFSNDNGTRVPLLANWKGKINGGTISETMISPSDFIPTIFEAIGRNLPKDFHTDGQSFLPQMLGEKSNRKDWVLIDHNPRPGWDKENFIPTKFVKGRENKLYSDGRFYNVDKDPLEKNSLDQLSKSEVKTKKKYAHILDSLRRYRTFGSLEALSPKFHNIVPRTTKIEVVAEGFDWSEGPAWVEEEQAVFFSDVPRNVVYKWSDVDGLEIFLKPSGYTGSKPRTGGKGTNGLATDNEGRLVLCQQGDRQIGRMLSSYHQPLPVYEALVTHYQGKRINSPNDLCIDTKGNIYFTDPPFGMDKDLLPDSKELDFNGVYRYNTDGSLDLLLANLPTPNGIGLSLDEKTLYVSNSNPAKWLAYELDSKGKIKKEKWVFHAQKIKEKSISKMVPDGMAIDDKGNIFGAGPDGILILSPQGEHLGTIKTKKRTSNCVFNKDKTILYVTCDDYLLRIVLGYKLGFAE
nr:sulfatase-like hydrolase/transferase [Allomuricauda sp.]